MVDEQHGRASRATPPFDSQILGAT